MKKVTKLSYLAMTILLVSCNEKVSPELLQSNTTAPTTVAVPPEEFYFSLVNKSPLMQGYTLHKTGPGNKSALCEVRNTTGMSNDIFVGDQVSNDISCFFEAEELSLLHGGFSFAVNASKNTCDYVGYSPFGFYDRIPGNSTATYNYVSCSSIANTNPSRVASQLSPLSTTTNAGVNTVACGEYFIDAGIIAPGTREKFTVADEGELCRFNYPDGPSCDIGIVTVNEYQITYTEPQAGPPAVPESWKTTKVTRKINCGGKITNCVSGPVADMKSGVSKFTEITNTNLNEEYTKDYSYGGLQQGFVSVKSYTNYRRDLASKNIDFMTSNIGSAAYTGIWNTSFNLNRIFDPQVMDFYSNNKKLDGSTLITANGSPNLDVITESKRDPRFQAIPYAADPFLGLAYPVNPYYTFYCFDKAFDVKARIRMVVREWDRIFPTDTSDLELLSDLGKGVNARQDSTVVYEVPGDSDGWLYINDLEDWDDHIPMQRTPGAFVPTTTIWQPLPTAGYPEGFFNPAYFTNGLDSID